MTFLSAFTFMTPSFLISGNCSVMLIFDVLLSHQDETKLTVQRNPKKLLICMIRSFSYVENITFQTFKVCKRLFTFCLFAKTLDKEIFSRNLLCFPMLNSTFLDAVMLSQIWSLVSHKQMPLRLDRCIICNLDDFNHRK